MGASFEGNDVIKLDGLAALAKAVKMDPPMARIGILGRTTSRKKAQKNARSFAKTLGAVGKWKTSKQILKEGVKSGSFGSTNATIGAAHEFGSLKRHLPKRSFLREPLIDHLQESLNAAGVFSEATQAEIIKEKSMVPWTKRIAVLAEDVVKKAFDTGGYGKWPKLSKETLAHKTTKDILVETTQLRDSIISDVKKV